MSVTRGTCRSKKPFKLHLANTDKRIGVIAENIKDLREKARTKFSLGHKDFTLFLEEDGTEVDDDEYLKVLPPQVVLIVLVRGTKWTPVRKLEEVLSSLLNANKLRELQGKVNSLLISDSRPEIRRLLGEVANQIQATHHYEKRDDDPAWFKDLGKCYKTKNQYMRENARRRIRSYLRIAYDFVNRDTLKLQAIHKHELQSVLRTYEEQLDMYDEYSDYFARESEEIDLRLCDPEGWFKCEGLYDRSECDLEQHRINPYGSWQQRVLFSTWNLDHGIEKSREVLPALVQAVKERQGRDLNWLYFYQLLFTRQNLKLVHIECHDKKEHSLKCDPTYFYL